MRSAIASLGLLFFSCLAWAGSFPEASFKSGVRQVSIRALNDDVLQLEYRENDWDDKSAALLSSPHLQSDLSSFQGPLRFSQSEWGIVTENLSVEIKSPTLCLQIRRGGQTVSELCPSPNKSNGNIDLKIAKRSTQAVYGLGEYFDPDQMGQANGDWLGKIRKPGSSEGNAMTDFLGGATGNAQFPIMYAVSDKSQYALFVDTFSAQTWNFKSDPFLVSNRENPLRLFFISGASLANLRSSFMNLVGRPLVPPKKAFGLWVSEYGFDDWDEVRSKLKTLRKNGFPIDGFILDLQWFGGVWSGSKSSSMGKLEFDPAHFPEPRSTIAEFADREGVGFVTIEESYISEGLMEFAELQNHGFLLRKHPGKTDALIIDDNPWWGIGGMMDWTNPNAGAFWHNWKRQPLVSLGILGHWTDLGEPEMYRSKSSSALGFYHGFPELKKSRQSEVHNSFSLMWSKSIYDGYQANHAQQRPWILSRSGAPGIQRYGSAMWSGDIGSNFASLRSHMNTQMHMSLSGIDYYGSDIGGFHREGIRLEPDTKLDDLYTKWFAYGAAFDVPVRPHTENLSNSKETAPDRIGDLASNRQNLRLRYALVPYYYSLAHRSYNAGEPLMPPLVLEYPHAPKIKGVDPKQIADQKMIGRDLMFVSKAVSGRSRHDIYLPPGVWYDYHSGQRYQSANGQVIQSALQPASNEFRLPLFARAGAIIPLMHVDEKTMNVFGRRTDGTERTELIVRVFPSATASSFTVYEDDGVTDGYRRGEVVETLVEQPAGGNEVTIHASRGTYPGALSQRQYNAQFVGSTSTCEVFLNQRALPHAATMQEFEKLDEGYFAAPDAVLAKSGLLSVGDEKTFACRSKRVAD